MIFLMATDVPDSWSFAELLVRSASCPGKEYSANSPDEAKSAHAHRLEVDITSGNLKDCSKDRKLDKVGHVGERRE